VNIKSVHKKKSVNKKKELDEDTVMDEDDLEYSKISKDFSKMENTITNTNNKKKGLSIYDIK
jgi:hypothetical protein